MNVVLIGASGRAGSRILKELLSRGHEVKAIVRDTSKLAAGDGVSVEQDDVFDVGKTAEIIKGRTP